MKVGLRSGACLPAGMAGQQCECKIDIRTRRIGFRAKKPIVDTSILVSLVTEEDLRDVLDDLPSDPAAIADK
jgi:hypothetical protein